MNIFMLASDPHNAAKYHCDQHICKMIVEYAQMLSTAHRVIDGRQTTKLSKSNRKLKYWVHPDASLEETLYKPSHVNHPSNVWVRSSRPNYKWLYDCFIELGRIFEVTSGKPHATITKLSEVLANPPEYIPERGLTPIPLCMPEEYQNEHASPVESYREFYRKSKSRFATFKRNGVPEWW